MRVAILTSSFSGLASFCIPRLVEEPEIEISMVIYNEGRILNPCKERRHKMKKILNLGLLGAINGLRMRHWFKEGVQSLLKIERLDVVASRFGIRLEKTPAINCQRTVNLFLEANAKLGLSLGNTYIDERIFSIPQYGMINIHHEALPQFQGAQSIIWQIYQGSLETGYTIHKINRDIDGGDILYQEKLPIELKPTFRETVTYNSSRLYEVSVKGLVNVVKRYPEFLVNVKPQVAGQAFTTPTFWQYLRMVRQYRKLYQESNR